MSKVRTPRRRCLPRIVLPTALLVLTGCGGGVGDISGTVKYKNKALSNGTVTIYASDGKAYQGQIEANGTYRIAQVPIGEAKITVSVVATSSVKDGKATTTKSGLSRIGIKSDSDPTPPKAASGSPIPLSYADVSQSTLTVKVTAGQVQHDIDLN